MITDKELENLGDFINAVRSHEEVILLLTNIGETHYSAQEINEMLEPFYKEEQQRRQSVTDEAVQMQVWIPVSERLPDIGQRVKIRKTSAAEEAIYLNENPFAPWLLIDERDGSVTSLFKSSSAVQEWMPLPEPPKGEIR